MEPAARFDELFTNMRATLQSVRSGTVPHDDDPGSEETVRTIGQAGDGRLVVSFLGNRVERVDIDPRLLQKGADALGELVTEAVNAALDSLRSSATDIGIASDTAALVERLDQLQTESVRSMTAMSAMLTEAVQRISRAGR